MAAPTTNSASTPPVLEPNGKRLVLCFDGTRNKFTGDETDTNIVQIYKLLNRKDVNQFHYYQPGIGSYVPGHMSNGSGSLYTRIKNSILEHWDEAFGSSFVHHVIAGYKFLMRYYSPGDKIYIFGFSRGAYTARYLTEMIYHIGLLSEGNEEMILFAWDTFSKFQSSRVEKDTGTPGEKDPYAFLKDFKESFCRSKVTVHFLGLFDCVNSVSQFQSPFARASSPYLLESPASHVRHAVSIHERRVAFKPALFLVEEGLKSAQKEEHDVEEVFFAGNHGDVGGGWGYEPRLKAVNPSAVGVKTRDGVLPVLLSDIALHWMLKEVSDLDSEHRKKYEEENREDNTLTWQMDKVKVIDDKLELLNDVLSKKIAVTNDKAARNMFHDPLKINRGCSRWTVFFWWLLETMPFIPYYDLNENDKWVSVWFRPNYGRTRKLPTDVQPMDDGKTYFHESVARLKGAGVILDDEMSKPGQNSRTWSPFGTIHWENGRLKSISSPFGWGRKKSGVKVGKTV